MPNQVLGCSPQESGAPPNPDGTPFPGHAPLILVIGHVITDQEYSRLGVKEQRLIPPIGKRTRNSRMRICFELGGQVATLLQRVGIRCAIIFQLRICHSAGSVHSTCIGECAGC